MAASLGVEWAKLGVRVNALRSVHSNSLIISYWLSLILLSPGYMLTKLTKQVLSGDEELRVCIGMLDDRVVI